MRQLWEMDEDSDITVDPMEEGGGDLGNEQLQSPNE